MDYQVKIQVFEGPFDLLFHLIEQEKINIYDIPIAEITEQYLSYIESARMMDLEISSEFILMAATLLKIKSKMLLPKPAVTQEEDSEDPRKQLVERLIEYRLFKKAAAFLRQKEKEQEGIFTRNASNISDLYRKPAFVPGNLTLEALENALKIVQLRMAIKNEQPEQSHEIQKESMSVRKKISQLAKYLLKNKKLKFSQLFAAPAAPAEIIITLLALLEMVRIKKAVIIQEELFGEIIVYDPIYYKYIT